MTNEALIRRCVGWADGWEWCTGTEYEAWTPWCEKDVNSFPWDMRYPWVQDALRCQLERQYVDAIYAEALTDGGWQVQITPKDTCEQSDWFEAETISEAALTAIDEFMRGQK